VQADVEQEVSGDTVVFPDSMSMDDDFSAYSESSVLFSGKQKSMAPAQK